MNSLVGYESSSDEDGITITEAHSVTASNQTTLHPTSANGQKKTINAVSASTLDEDSVRNTENEHGPMVGPTMPFQMDNDNDNDNDNDVSQEPSPSIPQTMSERDAIRYLTQATHPMTSIPPSPPDSPDPVLNTKFNRFLDLKTKGIHFNDDLVHKSTFRNPILLTTMMTRAGLDGDDQYRTSLPREIWDPLSFPPFAFNARS